MIISVTFKTPDAVANATFDAYDGKFGGDMDYEDTVSEVQEKLKKWVRWGELVTVDFDLDAGTATVREMS